MISLDRDEHQAKKYPFPAFDFLFRNTGPVAALIWKFRIVVLEAVIDERPELAFYGHVENGKLHVAVRDNGWGQRRKFAIEVGENRLNHIFPTKSRQFTGQIKGGDHKEILVLSPSDADHERLAELATSHDVARERTAFTQEFRDSVAFILSIPVWGQDPKQRQPDPEQRHLLNIAQQTDLVIISSDYDRGCSVVDFSNQSRWPTGELHARWRSLEDSHSGDSPIRHPFTTIVLAGGQFLQTLPDIPAGACLYSDTIYAVIVDPLKGSHIKEYAISRKVPPGDVDRFHILIGASMSARLKIRVDFFVDAEIVITGKEIMTLEIWNPRNKCFHKNFSDGQELHEYW